MKKIRWRLRNTEGRNSQRKRYYNKYREARNSRRKWKKVEDRAVLLREVPDNILHVFLGRSVQAIQTRRSNILNHALRFFN